MHNQRHMMPLTIKPPSRPTPTAQLPPVISASPSSRRQSIQKTEGDREGSPEPPPASPLTPVARPAKPATQPEFIQQPPSQPFSSHDSTDAIALRAAISSLQFQRLQAQNDLRALEDIKRQAVERPEEYRQHVLDTAGKPSPPPSWKSPVANMKGEDTDQDAVTGADDSNLVNSDRTSDSRQSPEGARVSFGSMLHPQGIKTTGQSNAFPPVPKPQDVVRCPPIEWAKYNIVGEPLDRMHQDQQSRPGGTASAERDSLIAAPYNPFLDKLSGEGQQAAKAPATGRKDSGAAASEQHLQRRRSSKPSV